MGSAPCRPCAAPCSCRCLQLLPAQKPFLFCWAPQWRDTLTTALVPCAVTAGRADHIAGDCLRCRLPRQASTGIACRFGVDLHPTRVLILIWRPQVKFASRVNLSYVDQNTGVVEARGVPILSNWNRSCNLERLLQELRREMTSSQNRRNPQPPDGSMY